MAWRTGSSWFIAAGATIRMEFWWGRLGDDKGPQWAMGHPMRGEPPATLATERVAKSVACEIGVIIVNGPPEYRCGDPETAYWRYYVDIHNEGPSGCRFQLEGGGV